MAEQNWTLVCDLETDDPSRVTLTPITWKQAVAEMNEYKRSGYDTRMAVMSVSECEFLGIE
jgi:hypothetical protein